MRVANCSARIRTVIFEKENGIVLPAETHPRPMMHAEGEDPI